MTVEWDDAKAASNHDKHGVTLEDASLVLEDPRLLVWDDPDAEGEPRYLGLGMDAFGRVLVVVYTHRDEVVRLISARRATAKERQVYARGI